MHASSARVFPCDYINLNYSFPPTCRLSTWEGKSPPWKEDTSFLEGKRKGGGPPMKIVDTPLLRKFFRAASSAILPSISCRILNYKILRTCRGCSAGSIESHPPRLGYGFRLPDESRFYGHRTGSSGFVIDELCELRGSAVRMGWRGGGRGREEGTVFVITAEKSFVARRTMPRGQLSSLTRLRNCFENKGARCRGIFREMKSAV